MMVNGYTTIFLFLLFNIRPLDYIFYTYMFICIHIVQIAQNVFKKRIEL